MDPSKDSSVEPLQVHQTPNSETIKAFIVKAKEMLGATYVLDDASSLETYGKDWTKVWAPNPSVVVMPGSTSEVQMIVGLCKEMNIPMVPSGGRTGLAAAAVATKGEVVVSLNRMNKIIEIDSVGMSITTEAGVTTQELQEAAKDKGLCFPIDLGAKGSCQIGGNIATNAGGVKFIRYGGTRDQVLGIEVVLASGEVLDLNRNLKKDNSGYDLKQLFVGSEGTLGIITKAIVKLAPLPRHAQVALMAVPEFGHIPKLLTQMNLDGLTITAFEFFTRQAHEKVLDHKSELKSPFQEKSPFYVLIELEEPNAGSEVMESLLEKTFELSLISDAVVASSSAQFHELWGFRENITESLADYGHVRKNDVSVPVHLLGPFLEGLESLEVQGSPGNEHLVELIIFGHIGDGNLHINYVSNGENDYKEFVTVAEKMEEEVFALVKKFQGSISAEHGIGLLKKQDLHFTVGAQEVALMRQIKKVLDPSNLMNPGKIFD